MIDRKNYLFVMGAGTAMPYNFPSGTQLVQSLEKNTREGEALHGYLTRSGYSKEVKAFHDALRKSGSVSIDSFLEHRTDLQEIGKMCITLELSQYEYNSNLYEMNPGNSLYHYLLNHMKDDIDSIKNNRIAFITYNYDRSLEYFLFNGLVNSYNLPQSKVIEILEHIPIIHVHGKIGYLEWETEDGSNSLTYNPYGQSYQKLFIHKKFDQFRNLDQISKIINIVHEGEYSDDIQRRIYDEIQKAEEIVFLGFGYNEENLKKLGIFNSGIMNTSKINLFRGTTMGLTQLERKRVIATLKKTNLNVRLDEKNLTSLMYIRSSIPLQNPVR